MIRTTLFLLFFLFSATNIQAQTAFFERQISPIPENPRDVIAIDIDNDSDIDIITASEKGTIDIFENNGLTFSVQTVFKSEFNSISPAIDVADIDGDGDLDIVCNIAFGTSVNHWLENTGTLNFTPHVLDMSGTNAFAMQSIDFDQDGDKDIVLSSEIFNGYKFEWYENDGNQNFTENLINTTISNANGNLPKIDVKDVDNDGDWDVSSLSISGSLVWFENDGNQNFTTNNVDYITTGALYSFASKDMDLDGDIDFITGSTGASNAEIRIYLNDGNQNFTYSSFNTNNIVVSDLIVDDLDDDGDEDIIIIGEYQSDSIEWFENNGSLNFTQHTISNRKNETYGVFVEDINQDGDQDIVAVSVDDDRVEWLENDGFENFTSHTLSLSTTLAKDISLADYDNDGDFDIINSGLQDGRIVWFKHSGGFNFSVDEIMDSLTANPSQLEVADIDNDGDQDIVFSIGGSLYVGTQDTLGIILDTLLLSGFTLNNLQIIDLDDDGFLDIISQHSASNSLRWWKNNTASVFSEIAIATGSGQALTNALQIVDYNNDGALDILNLRGDVYYLQNDGNENFTEHLLYNGATNIHEFQTGDIDGDTDLDIVIGSDIVSTSKFTGWLENNGTTSASFTPILAKVIDDPSNLEVHDFDDDGDLDFVIIDDNYVYLFDNDGNQNFTEIEITFVIGGVTDAVLGDIDGDGDADIAMTGSSTGRIVILENLIYNHLANVNTISYVDLNENSLLDGNDYLFEPSSISIQPNDQYVYRLDGLSTIVLNNENQYTFETKVDTSIWSGTNPLMQLLDIDTIPFDTTLLFGLKPNFDLLLSTDLTANWPRCGDTVNQTITIQNLGKLIDSVWLEYTLDDSISFVSSTPAPNSISGQTLLFNYADLLTAETKSIALRVDMPVQIQLVESKCLFFADTGQSVLIDSTILTDTVRCSYDPNDKQVSPNYGNAGYILNSDNELEYLIRFQNTGNDTAFLVIIQDTLDSKLDLSTFRLISYSDSLAVNIDGNSRIASFIFENINLTDTVTNEADSHGFVKFAIKPILGLQVDDEITNTAGIFFDENPPIVTNTTLNTIYDCSDLGNSLSFPNGLNYLDGELISATLNESFVNTIEWVVSNTVISQNDNYENVAVLGNDEIILSLMNDLCQKDSLISLIIIQDPNSVSEVYEHLNIYPNPTSGAVFIEIEDANPSNYSFQVQDVTGKTIENGNISTSKTEIQLNKNSGGIYFIKVENEEGSFAFYKILKE